MHIVHLAVGVDVVTSVVMDVVDLNLATLKGLWENYREWCEDGGLSDVS